tara:strand:+ start:623 stop:901 length:279 start_codon:yes stop_codon:yes gene_type:complete
LANAKDERGDQVLYLYDDRSSNRSISVWIRDMDLDNEFDREVWREVCKARTSMERAMMNATKLGLTDLVADIDDTRSSILRLQAKCSEISNA